MYEFFYVISLADILRGLQSNSSLAFTGSVQFCATSVVLSVS